MVPAADKPLVLIGLMATGKSTIGRRIAARNGWRFVDSDAEIVRRHGPISGIFASLGEEGFRDIEADVVAALLARADGRTVVSLGGGSVLREETRRLLASTFVVFLDADLATVLPRLAGDTGRPLLAGDAGETWARLERERRPIYEALADAVIDTRNASPEAVVDSLETQLRRHNPTEEGTLNDDR